MLIARQLEVSNTKTNFEYARTGILYNQLKKTALTVEKFDFLKRKMLCRMEGFEHWLHRFIH